MGLGFRDVYKSVCFLLDFVVINVDLGLVRV